MCVKTVLPLIQAALKPVDGERYRRGGLPQAEDFGRRAAGRRNRRAFAGICTDVPAIPVHHMEGHLRGADAGKITLGVPVCGATGLRRTYSSLA